MSTQAAIDYFQGDELSASVWFNKYALRDKEGNVVETTPADTHRRLAKEFARIEAKYPNPLTEEEIFEYLSDWTIVPQGSPMSAIGNPHQLQSLSNCLSGDVEILTLEYGSVPIKEVAGQEVHLLDGNGNWIKCPILCHGEQETYELTFKGGFEVKTIRSTLEHRWISSSGKQAFITKMFDYPENKREVGYLLPDRDTSNEDDYRKGLIHGLIYGDGTASWNCNKNEKYKNGSFGIRVCCAHEDTAKILEGFTPTYPPYAKGDPVYYLPRRDLWDTNLKSLPSSSVSTSYLTGFIRGWFAADGCVSTDQAEASICGGPEELEWLKKWAPLIGIQIGGYTVLAPVTNFGPRKKQSLTIRFKRCTTVVGDFLLTKHKNNWLNCEHKLRRANWRVHGKYSNPKKELVYCPVVPTTHSFALACGIHSGNCLVVPNPVDSYGGILFSDQQLVQLMKRRCGVGIDISSIRPKGLPTSNAAGTTDGIGVFMERYSNSCREVAQGGRRGALMISIHCLHPDIETFIAIKQDKTKVTGANVSIRVTDEFMRAVKSDQSIVLRWPVDSTVENAKWTRTVSAKELWNKFTEANWNSAEPGILFWDTIIYNSMADIFADSGFVTVSVNPCSELSLSALDSCRLLLVNYTKFVIRPFTPEALFNYGLFYSTCRKAQRLMDDLVDLEIEAIDRIISKIKSDPEPESIKQLELDLWLKVREMAFNGRRTGLGETGLGDTLAMLGLKYGCDESIEVTEKLHRAQALAAHEESVLMAEERGAFPACVPSKYDAFHPMVEKLYNNSSNDVNDLFHAKGRRNIALTTIAPAGSMSIMTQTTSGCEPVFMLEYKRRKKINPNDSTARVDFVDDLGDKWSEHTVYHHGLKKWMEVTGETDITKSPYYGATANEINWEKSVELQAAAQKWVEHSISKTCNLPASVTKEQVSDLYFKAWESGCKGFTIYRDGSRSGVLVANESKKEESIASTKAPKRPAVLKCDIHRTTIAGESYVMLVGLLNNQPYEVFCGLSKNIGLPKSKITGTITKRVVKTGVAAYDLAIPSQDDEIIISNVVDLFDNPLYGAFTRTLSLSLRHGVPVQFIVEQLRKDKYSDMHSFGSAVARVLSKHYIVDGVKVTGEKKCSECGSDSLVYQSGCVSCQNCGNSKCG